MRFFTLIILIINLPLLGLSCLLKETPSIKQEIPMINKNILIIIAFNGFQDFEYSKTREILEKSGAKITIASSSFGIASGKFGLKVEIGKTLEEISINDYDAIIFIGGPGAEEYFENKKAHELIKEAFKNNKIIGGICIAPVILAKAGILKGKKATVWSSIIDKSPIEILKNNEAYYIDEDVVVDGNIITANGPNAAEKFAQAILNQLK
jgi:protease I